MDYIPLSIADLALAALFLVLNGLLSIWLSLGIGRLLLVAALRMIVQLAAVGTLLTWLFGAPSLAWTLVLALIMALFAGREVLARQRWRLAGWWAFGLGTGAMTVAAATVMGFALAVTLQPTPWYDPRFAIPLFGMILGNAMTGISLGLDTLMTAAVTNRAAIEARIALGEPRFSALRPTMQEAMRRGFLPMLNAMSACGVVFLPGMMTGQILSGVAPAEAVRYQLLIMFLIAGATGLGLLTAIVAGTRRLTDDRHRLRIDRLVKSPE